MLNARSRHLTGEIAGTWAGLLGSQWIDYVVIRQFLPLAELGRYSLAYQMAGGVQQLTIIVGTLLLPRYSAMLARGDESRARLVVERAVPYWLLGFSLLLGVLVAASEPLVPLLLGRDVRRVGAPLGLLLVAVGAGAIFGTGATSPCPTDP